MADAHRPSRRARGSFDSFRQFSGFPNLNDRLIALMTRDEFRIGNRIAFASEAHRRFPDQIPPFIPAGIALDSKNHARENTV